MSLCDHNWPGTDCKECAKERLEIRLEKGVFNSPEEILYHIENLKAPNRMVDKMIATYTGHFDYKLRYGFEDCAIEIQDLCWTPYREVSKQIDVRVHVPGSTGGCIYSEELPFFTQSIDAVEKEFLRLYGDDGITFGVMAKNAVVWKPEIGVKGPELSSDYFKAFNTASSFAGALIKFRIEHDKAR